MSKKDKIIETIEVEDASLLPELLDGKHHVIPIVTGGDEVAEEVEVPEIIPILTLRSSVLFPGAITPITVGRDKSISLVRAVNAEGGIDPVHGAVLDHLFRAEPDFFGGLEAKHHRPAEFGADVGEHLRRRQEHRDVAVVTARVHETGAFARERQPGFFRHGKRVDVAAQKNRAADTKSVV